MSKGEIIIISTTRNIGRGITNMQIHKNTGTNSTIFSSSHRNLIAAVSLALVLVTSLLATALHQNLFSSSLTAHASDTPTSEACFATTGTETKAITSYHSYENNDSANPACPRDVVIPSTIDGIEVTTIDDAANYWNPSTATSFASSQTYLHHPPRLSHLDWQLCLRRQQPHFRHH